MFRHSAVLALLAALTGVQASAAKPKRPADTLEQRLKACAVCHGEQGERLTKAQFYPRLAGKPARWASISSAV